MEFNFDILDIVVITPPDFSFSYPRKIFMRFYMLPQRVPNFRITFHYFFTKANSDEERFNWHLSQIIPVLQQIQHLNSQVICSALVKSCSHSFSVVVLNACHNIVNYYFCSAIWAYIFLTFFSHYCLQLVPN